MADDRVKRSVWAHQANHLFRTSFTREGEERISDCKEQQGRAREFSSKDSTNRGSAISTQRSGCRRSAHLYPQRPDCGWERSRDRPQYPGFRDDLSRLHRQRTVWRDRIYLYGQGSVPVTARSEQDPCVP
jgi:hypothetical protein